MQRHLFLMATAAIFLEVAAAPALPSPSVQYGPAPAWITAPPAPTATAPLPGSPTRVVYFDQQIRVGPAGDDVYTAYRIKILAPQALAVGNLNLAWSPTSQQITVHRLALIRDGRVIDVLAQQKFDVIQRETNLEAAMLDGVRTATLQTAGLQVGDEIEFAATLHQHDPNLGANAQGFAQLPPQTALGAFRVRALWPTNAPLTWRATPDMGTPVKASAGSDRSVEFVLRDPTTVVSPDGAPPRYDVHRLFQYSTFASWTAVSRQLQPLFAEAAILSPNSPIRAEAAKLAAVSADPVKRAEAALQLVQDRIRYVYVGLDRANYRPAAVDDTWERRFGDCKAKTVLLIALLRELGIAAEPVLVASNGGDGTNERLPTTQLFDHVLVRASVNGTAYWLDGTRLGDRSLAALPGPAFRWGLPLRASGATLEPVAPVAPTAPLLIDALDIDASAGFDTPAKVQATRVIRGDEAFQLRTQLAAMAPADADRALSGYWKQAEDWITPAKTGWRTDAAEGAVVLTVGGTGKLNWDGDAKNGRTLAIPGAGFTPPAKMERPAEQDSAAPWALEVPRFSCYATTIHLPPAGTGFAWTYKSAPVARRFAGAEYYREASLENGVMRTVMSRRAVDPEITAAQAKLVNAALPNFDNNISQVIQTGWYNSVAQPTRAEAAFLAKPIDWTSPTAPCRLPPS